MKQNAVSLDAILAKELKNDEFRLAFDEHRFYLQIARLVSDLRARTGLSQSELAERAGVSQPMIARIEKGDRQRTPTFDTIFRLLKVLGYNMSIHVQRDKGASAA